MDNNNYEYIIGSDNEGTADDKIDELSNTSSRRKASTEFEEVPRAKKIKEIDIYFKSVKLHMICLIK